jgi:hypothetical protein
MFDEQFIYALAKALAPKVAELIKPHLVAKIAPRYLNLDQAADYLSTTPDGVRGMLRSKLFPCRKVGARVLIDIRDIDKTMDENVQYLNVDQNLDWLKD